MFHQTTILGHIGKSPEKRKTDKGTKILNFSVAVNDGDHTEWYRCVAFNKAAEHLTDLQKGQLVFLTARARTRKWEDDKKVTRWSTEYIVDTYRRVGRKAEAEEGADGW